MIHKSNPSSAVVQLAVTTTTTLLIIWFVQFLCLTSTLRTNSDQFFPQNGSKSLSAQRTQLQVRRFETDAERINASRRLWELFQRRNQPSEQSTSVLLYPLHQKLNNSVNKQEHPGFGSPTSDSRTKQVHASPTSFQNSNRRLTHPLQMLHTNPVPEFPVHLPRFPPEQPFNMQAILSPEAMLQLLGDQNYLPEFMSYVKPMEAIVYPEGYLTNRFNAPSTILRRHNEQQRRRRPGRSGSRRSAERLPMDVNKRLHIMHNQLWFGQDQTRYRQTFVGPSLQNEMEHVDRLWRTERRMRKRRRLRNALKRLLVDYTTCPVRYLWRDWGPRFWPRWVKEGQCVNVGDTSCSIPPGMYCSEAEHKDIVLLRYLCFTTWPKSSCSWYRLHFPVLSRCQCGCSAGSAKSSKREIT